MGESPKEDKMIYLLGTYEHALVAFIGVLFAFAATCIAIAKLNGYLPKDMGRQYAHDGALSAGKPRGAGIIFVLTFVVSALLFGKMNKEIVIYLVLIVIEMFTGFFDDAAEKPWGEYLKGILDLAVAVVVAISYLHYNSSEITIAITGTTIVIPPVVFAILTVILVWVSINVTNCSDGVDGLSGTLTIITLMSVFVLDNILKVNDSFNYCILLFAVCLLGYLWYNATPSKLLMGDAGSRAMGIFIAIAVLKMHSPFMYLLVAAVLIADGGLGLADDLADAQVYIIMGMVVVADRVFAVGEVDGVVVHHLDVAPVQDALVVVRDHVLDPGLLGVEVVAHLLHVVGLVALGHDRPAVPFAGEAVIDAAGEHGPGVHVVLHVVGGQLHVLVLHRRGAVVVDEPVAVGEVADHGIRRIGEGRHLERALAQQGHGVGLAQGVHVSERIPARQGGGVGEDDLFLDAGPVDGPASTPVASQLRIRIRR